MTRNRGKPILTHFGHALCPLSERKSIIMVSQREDLLGPIYATHDVVTK
jgi:hypothetical protein